MLRSIENLLARTRVRHVSQRTLEWIRTNEDEFRISFAPGDSAPWQIKPLVELMFLVNTLRRKAVHNRILDRLAARALNEAADFDWRELGAYDPSAATPLALVADFFNAYGRPAPFDSRFFAFLSGIEYFEGMDRLPYREMDLAHCLGRAVSPDYEKSLPVWFGSTAFGRKQNLTRYTIDDIYSLTHAIFYLTDLGFRDIGHYLESATAARVRSELPALTAIMLRADNVDVLGELLLCWIFCEVKSTRLNDLIFEQALDRMLSSTTPEGAVAPTRKSYQLARSGQATFSHLYHTTLVGAMLFALLSQKDSYANGLVA
jgi:hypothetical protein